MRIFSNSEKDDNNSIFDKYSLAHLLSGLLWFIITYILEKSLFYSFFILYFSHIVFEIMENSQLGININRDMGWYTYNGDSGYNIIGDQLSVVVGFFIGYILFK